MTRDPNRSTFDGLTFEALINDPMTRMVMQADRVSDGELADVMRAARAALAARRREGVSPAAVIRLASYEPA
jgi:hypothetical protein